MWACTLKRPRGVWAISRLAGGLGELPRLFSLSLRAVVHPAHAGVQCAGAQAEVAQRMAAGRGEGRLLRRRRRAERIRAEHRAKREEGLRRRRLVKASFASSIG